MPEELPSPPRPPNTARRPPSGRKGPHENSRDNVKDCSSAAYRLLQSPGCLSPQPWSITITTHPFTGLLATGWRMSEVLSARGCTDRFVCVSPGIHPSTCFSPQDDTGRFHTVSAGFVGFRGGLYFMIHVCVSWSMFVFLFSAPS
jgi:hypothetical protein